VNGADERFLIVGGAGFIGSHFTDRLLASPRTRRVTLYDNFSSGQAWHYADHRHDPRLDVVRRDVHDLAGLKAAMAGHDTVIHLASNPDIARAVTEPDIDFREGTELTQCVVEAMRQTGTRKILYASGSGVYGEIGVEEAREDRGPLVPISTYGASKLAGEALIAAYCSMFAMRGRVFRFGNVVGRRQTHGIGFDFVRRLRQDPTRLRILGDGRQSKSYVHVSDIVTAVLLASETAASPFEAFNVATGDYITVSEIATLACACMGLAPEGVRFEYTGGDRGWKGDVPVIRLNIDKICRLGWRPTRTSARALSQAMQAMRADLEAGCDQEGEIEPGSLACKALSDGLSGCASLAVEPCSSTIQHHPAPPRSSLTMEFRRGYRT
jgi:UDP-glucose 4-epimerase